MDRSQGVVRQNRAAFFCKLAVLLRLKGKNMFSVIGMLLIGLVVGFIARAVKPGDDKLGWIMTALLGVAGSFLAGYVGTAMGWYQQGDAAGWIASVLGAVVLLVLFGLIKSKT